MDPGRIHAYLQAACAGLGFDIGEVWFSSNDSGTSTVAQIGKSLFNIESNLSMNTFTKLSSAPLEFILTTNLLKFSGSMKWCRISASQ